MIDVAKDVSKETAKEAVKETPKENVIDWVSATPSKAKSKAETILDNQKMESDSPLELVKGAVDDCLGMSSGAMTLTRFGEGDAASKEETLFLALKAIISAVGFIFKAQEITVDRANAKDLMSQDGKTKDDAFKHLNACSLNIVNAASSFMKDATTAQEMAKGSTPVVEQSATGAGATGPEKTSIMPAAAEDAPKADVAPSEKGKAKSGSKGSK